jgi:VanZ family protein
MKISTFLKPLSFLPALALMYMIYSFSGQDADASSALSYHVSEMIVRGVDRVTAQHWEEWQIQQHTEQIHYLVRKGAHVTEYFLLAIAVSFPLYVYGVRGLFLMLLAGIICLAYACGDEYHQAMVSGRYASRRDVGIDSIGIFAGVILVRLLGWSGRMAITGPRYERRQKKEQAELERRERELSVREKELQRREMELRSKNSRPDYDPRRLQTDEGFSPENEHYNRRNTPYPDRSPQAAGAEKQAPSGRRKEFFRPRKNRPVQNDLPHTAPAEEEGLLNSPDELSEDMPLARFLKGRKK